MRSKGEGLYSCSYLPSSPIKHTLALTWGGVSVPNSPFRVSSQSRPSGGGASASEFLFRAERIELVQSESPKDAGKKPKKPLIIIVTHTEEKYSF